MSKVVPPKINDSRSGLSTYRDRLAPSPLAAFLQRFNRSAKCCSLCGRDLEKCLYHGRHPVLNR